jgi:hypothetical protein
VRPRPQYPMCTPSFMCKFPFSGREFVALEERVS